MFSIFFLPENGDLYILSPEDEHVIYSFVILILTFKFLEYGPLQLKEYDIFFTIPAIDKERI